MKKLFIVLITLAVVITVAYFLGYDSYFSTPGSKARTSAIEVYKEAVKNAEQDYRDQVESAEKVGVAYEKLANRYLFRKNWTPAISSYTKAIEYGRSGARVHYSIAVAYANRGKELHSKADVSLAEKHYKRSLEINRKLYDSQYGLSLLKFYMKNEKKEALRIMTLLANSQPSYYRARFALARFHYELNEPSKSLSIYEDLYSDLERKQESEKMKFYRKHCKQNITRLIMELRKTSK